MKGIEFKLFNDGEEYKIYNNHYYALVIEKRNNKIINIEPVGVEFPEIYIKYDTMSSKFKGLEIRKNMCTHLSREEILDSYNIAKAIKKEIEKNFLSCFW